LELFAVLEPDIDFLADFFLAPPQAIPEEDFFAIFEPDFLDLDLDFDFFAAPPQAILEEDFFAFLEEDFLATLVLDDDFLAILEPDLEEDFLADFDFLVAPPFIVLDLLDLEDLDLELLELFELDFFDFLAPPIDSDLFLLDFMPESSIPDSFLSFHFLAANFM